MAELFKQNKSTKLGKQKALMFTDNMCIKCILPSRLERTVRAIEGWIFIAWMFF